MRRASDGSSRTSFSGLPGVTSHHTASSRSRFIASSEAARCAACGGLNEPPNSPMRIPGECGGSEYRPMSKSRSINETTACSRPDLPRAVDTVFEGAELLDADRPARMQLAGRDADFGAEAELAAVGELR